MSAWQYDVAIAGAGIVGAACADELTSRGLRVVVADSDEPGAGATMAAMGHIVVMDDSEPQFSLTRYSQQLWKQLAADLSPDVEYDTCGTIWVAADDEELREVFRKRDYYAARDVPAQVLEPSELYTHEPELRRGMAGGLLVPEDVVVYPPCASRFFMERASRRGATFEHAALVRIGNHSFELADGERITARFLVNAAGSSAPELTPGVHLRKRKGHLAITDRYSGFLRHQLVELGYLKSAHAVQADSVAFNVQPRRTGQLLIGSSRQFDEQTKEVDYGILGRMLRRAQEYMPGIGNLSIIRVWTGFRAATPDKLPLIGPWPDDDSLLLATGHEGLGITTSLGTAKLLADQITGSPPEIPLEPYLPARQLKESGNCHAR